MFRFPLRSTAHFHVLANTKVTKFSVSTVTRVSVKSGSIERIKLWGRRRHAWRWRRKYGEAGQEVNRSQSSGEEEHWGRRLAGLGRLVWGLRGGWENSCYSLAPSELTLCRTHNTTGCFLGQTNRFMRCLTSQSLVLQIALLLAMELLTIME